MDNIDEKLKVFQSCRIVTKILNIYTEVDKVKSRGIIFINTPVLNSKLSNIYTHDCPKYLIFGGLKIVERI